MYNHPFRVQKCRTQADSKWQVWNTESSNVIEFNFEIDWNSFAYEICFAMYLQSLDLVLCKWASEAGDGKRWEQGTVPTGGTDLLQVTLSITPVAPQRVCLLLVSPSFYIAADETVSKVGNAQLTKLRLFPVRQNSSIVTRSFNNLNRVNKWQFT